MYVLQYVQRSRIQGKTKFELFPCTEWPNHFNHQHKKLYGKCEGIAMFRSLFIVHDVNDKLRTASLCLHTYSAVYRRGLVTELTGRANTITQAYTSGDIAVPPRAIIPVKISVFTMYTPIVRFILALRIPYVYTIYVCH